MEIFPADNLNIDELLNELQSSNLITRYVVESRGYIQVEGFLRHQNPHPKEKSLNLPQKPKAVEINVEKLNSASSRENVSTSRADILIPDILNPESCIPAVAEKFDQAKSFEEIWALYPVKDGKKEAFRHFKASVKSEADVIRIRNALNRYLGSSKVKDGFIKNGSTWFNNWQDWETYEEPTANQSRNGGVVARQRTAVGIKDLERSVAKGEAFLRYKAGDHGGDLGGRDPQGTQPTPDGGTARPPNGKAV